MGLASGIVVCGRGVRPGGVIVPRSPPRMPRPVAGGCSLAAALHPVQGVTSPVHREHKRE